MADNLDKLVAMLAESGTEATREQAERLAIRVAGSVDAYITDLETTRAGLKGYRPLEPGADGVPEKFSDPVAYSVEPSA
jgi:hypothetical protein